MTSTTDPTSAAEAREIAQSHRLTDDLALINAIATALSRERARAERAEKALANVADCIRHGNYDQASLIAYRAIRNPALTMTVEEQRDTLIRWIFNFPECDTGWRGDGHEVCHQSLEVYRAEILRIARGLYEARHDSC